MGVCSSLPSEALRGFDIWGVLLVGVLQHSVQQLQPWELCGGRLRNLSGRRSLWSWEGL